MRVSLKRRLVLLLLGAVLLGVAAIPGGAQDGPDPAVRRILTFYDSLLATMKQADRLGVRGRYEKLAPVVRETFDRGAEGSRRGSAPAARQADARTRRKA